MGTVYENFCYLVCLLDRAGFNSLETSSFIQIPSNGLTTIILSGNINNYVKLSVKNNNNTLSEELSLSEPVYIPNEQGISFEFDSGCQLGGILKQ